MRASCGCVAMRCGVWQFCVDYACQQGMPLREEYTKEYTTGTVDSDIGTGTYCTDVGATSPPPYW